MKSRRALDCLYTILLYLLLNSGPNAAQRQGDIPIINPSPPGGGGVTTTPTTTSTVNPESPPAPPQTGPTPTFGGTDPTGGGTDPTFGGTDPTFGGNVPAGGGTAPTFGGTAPTGGGTGPTGGGGGGTAPTGGGTTPTVGGTAPTGGGGQWCIASPSASQTALQVALDYACGYGGADCSMIQQGSGCYEPNTLRDHASFAFNDYYQKHPGPTSCVFGGAAQLTNTDPSSGNCHYTSSSGSTSMSPPSPPSPPDFTTPTTTNPTTTPATTMPGGGPTVYGAAEPTGEPSSANYLSNRLSLMFAVAGMLMPLLRGVYS